MRMILATASLALLAACGGGASNNSAGNSAGNGAAPASTAAAPNPQRENEMRECADDVRPEMPAGTDINAFCGCAVDKMQTGLGERDAMNQCAAQMGIRPNN